MLQILLATYNSERYLAAQLDSIFGQDEQDFQLLVRDGGSTDATLELLTAYRRRYGDRLRFLGRFPDTGARDNFAALLEAADGELLMFSDHDDVWLPDKVSGTLAGYRDLTRRDGETTPTLVFTDSRVVDADLRPLAASMLRFQHLNPTATGLARLLLQNVASGNTMLFNRALRALAVPIPDAAVMHDHWLALLAAACGRIGFWDRPTLLYRQHDANVLGASPCGAAFLARRARREGRARLAAGIMAKAEQAAALLERCRDRLTPADRALLEAFAAWPRLGGWEKRVCLLKYGIFKSGLLRNLGLFLTV